MESKIYQPQRFVELAQEVVSVVRHRDSTWNKSCDGIHIMWYRECARVLDSDFKVIIFLPIPQIETHNDI